MGEGANGAYSSIWMLGDPGGEREGGGLRWQPLRPRDEMGKGESSELSAAGGFFVGQWWSGGVPVPERMRNHKKNMAV